MLVIGVIKSFGLTRKGADLFHGGKAGIRLMMNYWEQKCCRDLKRMRCAVAFN
jgi:hypothetical protein